MSNEPLSGRFKRNVKVGGPLLLLAPSSRLTMRKSGPPTIESGAPGFGNEKEVELDVAHSQPKTLDWHRRLFPPVRRGRPPKPRFGAVPRC
jgi:hypothetical protein